MTIPPAIQGACVTTSSPSASRLPRATLLTIFLMAGVLVSACSPSDEGESMRAMETPAPQAANMMGAAPPAAAMRSRAMESKAAAAQDALPEAASDHAVGDAAPQRFLAVRHHMQIESPAAELADLWGAVKARCEQLDCQVEASALQRETSHSAAHAYLTMRVNPRDFDMLTAALGAKASVRNHQTSTEDMTGAVIDVEAQIKNRSEYRDSLRELLREKDVKRKLSDLMEIRDTLSEVQAEIDAAHARRKALEKETAKQFVQMQFQPQPAVISGTYSPWLRTWERSWDALTASTQAMLIATAAALPWLMVLGVGLVIVVLVLRRVLRGRKKAKTGEPRDAAASA